MDHRSVINIMFEIHTVPYSFKCENKSFVEIYNKIIYRIDIGLEWESDSSTPYRQFFYIQRELAQNRWKDEDKTE